MTSAFSDDFVKSSRVQNPKDYYAENVGQQQQQLDQFKKGYHPSDTCPTGVNNLLAKKEILEPFQGFKLHVHTGCNAEQGAPQLG